MKESPIKVCNDYFVRDNVNFSIMPNEIDMKLFNTIFQPVFDKYQPIFDEFLKEYDLENKLNKLDEDSTFFEVIVLMSNLIINLLKEKKMRGFLLEFMKTLLNNFETFALSLPLFDKELYFNFKIYLEQAIEKDNSKTAEIILKYFISIQNKLPIERIIKNITIIRDQYKKYENMSEKTTFKEILEKIEDNEGEIESNVVGTDRKSFEDNFYNFLISFGSIIEGYIKNSILTIGRLQNFIEGKESTYLDDNTLMIGDIFSNLNLINEKIDILRDYRNSISHFNFKINFSEETNERSFTFINKEKETNVHLEELLLDWVKTVQFINTFNLVMSFGIITIKNQEQDIYELMYRELEAELINAEEDLKSLPEISIDDFKKK